MAMADLIDLRTKLMDRWKNALKVAEATGYWGTRAAAWWMLFTTQSVKN